MNSEELDIDRENRSLLNIVNCNNVTVNVHRLMLRDSVRNKAYRQSILDNKDVLKGKIVLDVGAGTGILSVFCAQAGASKVYAVEASETYAIAQQIAIENGFENVIEVVHDTIENFKLPGDSKVDVIVSEWMGFYLLHEGMLDSVIFARDAFLKTGGLLFPEAATIYAAPCSVPCMYEDWDIVNGVHMKSFAKKMREHASSRPDTSVVNAEQILTTPEVVLWMDLQTITKAELDVIKIQHIVHSNKVARYQGICIWFTVTFPSGNTEPVILSTDPDDPATHWKQTTVVLPTESVVDENEPIAYEIMMSRSSPSARRYNLEVTMLDPFEIQHPEYCGCYMTKCILARAVLDKYENNKFNS